MRMLRSCTVLSLRLAVSIFRGQSMLSNYGVTKTACSFLQANVPFFLAVILFVRSVSPARRSFALRSAFQGSRCDHGLQGQVFFTSDLGEASVKSAAVVVNMIFRCCVVKSPDFYLHLYKSLALPSCIALRSCSRIFLRTCAPSRMFRDVFSKGSRRDVQYLPTHSSCHP